MDCDAELALGSQFMAGFNQRARERRIPISGSIEVTHRCNFNCVHCYLGAQSEIHQKALTSEISSAKFFQIIDEITEAGCLKLLFTGGDPFFRKDFLEIYKHAKQNGLLVTIFTNGTLISDAALEVLQAFPPKIIEITLYGATEQTYESITKIPGSYRKCLHAIEKLLAIKAHLKLKTMVININKHEFFAMEKMAKDWGVDFRFDCVVQPKHSGNAEHQNLRLQPEEIVAISFADPERSKLWVEQDKTRSGLQTSDLLYNCGAGRIGFHIDPYGNLMPCLSSIKYKYSLLTGSFLDGWNNFIPKIIAQKIPAGFVCTKCRNRFLCRFCPASFYLEGNSETKRADYLCAIGTAFREMISKPSVEK